VAISWHWAFGPETVALLQSDMGWTFASFFSTAPSSAAANVYSYAGSPTRYSMVGDPTFGGTTAMVLPAQAGQSPRGWISVPLKAPTSTLVAGRDLISVTGTTSGSRIYARTASGGQSLQLYVDNIFKATTAPYDWSDWRYVSLQYDMSTTTWSGRIYVDGVAATAAFTDPSTTQTSCTVGVAFCANGARVAQIIVHDDPADAGEVPRYVTRVEPNADGTDVGTWTPVGAATDWQALNSPLNTATYTQEASPSPGDRVEVLTNGGGSDLTTALGTTVTAIDSVCVHSYSTGQALTARPLVGDGTGEAAGGNVVVDPVNTSYGVAVANTRPGLGGAWTGSDAPTLVYEVVST
jgi:hypothetical protein